MARRNKPVVEESVDPRAGSPFNGDARSIVFTEGVHYPLSYDSDGRELGPDYGTPLVWRDGSFHHARPEDPRHNHVYAVGETKEIEVA